MRSASPSHALALTQARRSPSLPPSLKRRRLFYPTVPSSPPPAARSLHIDPHMSIPIHSPVHSLAATPCLSYVLTGSEDGYVRAWDTWSSANGGSLMTAHQRAVGGLGEGVTKGGVCRGWWENEGPLPPLGSSTSISGLDGVDIDGSERHRLREPVYSLALQRDALWGLSGTAVRSDGFFCFSLLLLTADYATHRSCRADRSTCSPSAMPLAGYSIGSRAVTLVPSQVSS